METPPKIPINQEKIQKLYEGCRLHQLVKEYIKLLVEICVIIDRLEKEDRLCF
jgi:hypothetical protein